MPLSQRQDWAIDFVLKSLGENHGDEPLTPAEAELLKLAQEANAQRPPKFINPFDQLRGVSPFPMTSTGAASQPRRPIQASAYPAEYVARKIPNTALRTVEPLNFVPGRLARPSPRAGNGSATSSSGCESGCCFPRSSNSH